MAEKELFFPLSDEEAAHQAEKEGMTVEEAREYFIVRAEGGERKVVALAKAYTWKMNQLYGMGHWSAEAAIPTREEIDNYMFMMGKGIETPYCLMKGIVKTVKLESPWVNWACCHSANTNWRTAKYMIENASTRCIRRTLQAGTNWGYLTAEELKEEVAENGPAERVPAEKPSPKKAPPKPAKKEEPAPLAPLTAFANQHQLALDSLGWDLTFKLWCKDHSYDYPAFSSTIEERPMSEKLLDLLAKAQKKWAKILAEYAVELTVDHANVIRNREKVISIRDQMNEIGDHDIEFNEMVKKYLKAQLNIGPDELATLSQHPERIIRAQTIISDLNDSIRPYVALGRSIASDLLQWAAVLNVPFSLLHQDRIERMGSADMTEDAVVGYCKVIGQIPAEQLKDEIMRRGTPTEDAPKATPTEETAAVSSDAAV